MFILTEHAAMSPRRLLGKKKDKTVSTDLLFLFI